MSRIFAIGFSYSNDNTGGGRSKEFFITFELLWLEHL
jgi:hypothetical protein